MLSDTMAHNTKYVNGIIYHDVTMECWGGAGYYIQQKTAAAKSNQSWNHKFSEKTTINNSDRQDEKKLFLKV